MKTSSRKRDLHPPKRAPRRALAVRMLAAKTAWLEGHPYWRDGRVVWEGEHGSVSPGAVELGQTHRALNQIRRYPVSSELALGDAEGWLRRRRSRLELAKRLASLGAPDLDGLARRARAGEPTALRELATLIDAEAHCLNPLSPSPAATLAACGPSASPLCRQLLDDPRAPEPTHALAGMVLGALAGGDAGAAPAPPAAAGWLRGAVDWGRRRGVPADPGLVVALLMQDPSGGLARRCVAARESRSLLGLPPLLLRQLLAEGVEGTAVVRLAEVPAGARELGLRLTAPWDGEPPRSAPARAAHAEWVEEQRVLVERLNEALAEVARATRDPEALRHALAFVAGMLELAPGADMGTEALTTPLRAASGLPGRLRSEWLRLLAEQRPHVWGDLPQPSTARRRPRARYLASSFGQGWGHRGLPLLRLLEKTRDPELVLAAADLNLAPTLASHRDWEDPAMTRLAVTLCREIYPSAAKSGHAWAIFNLLDSLPDAETARALLQPLVRATADGPERLRGHFLFEVLAAVPPGRGPTRDALSRLAPHAPALFRFAREDEGGSCVCDTTAAAAIALERGVPGSAAAWLAWLLGWLAEPERRRSRTWEHSSSLDLGIPLAVALADGDLALFQAAVRTAYTHPFDCDHSQVEAALPLLRRRPGLRAALAALFPRQPRRCVKLLVRLGLTARLGETAHEPLTRLEPEVGGDSLDGSAAWAELLALEPDLAGTAAVYQQMQRVLEPDTGPPRSVREALEYPRRLERELRFVEERIAGGDGDERWARRAATLRGRLADPAALAEVVQREVRKRLEHAADEAQLAAAERQVVACYRTCLEAMTGPLPPEREMDDDLVNAALLSANITQNRRLLRRLLRAHLAGDRQWRGRQPGNAAFLARLAARGVDPQVWLAPHPKRYRCARAPGGWVRLALETDPLRVLQMGNHFDTCLSLGRENAYSTVTNACELNKRVAYARDGEGRVVGRKLLAVTEEGGLVGFRTYTSMPDFESNQEIERLFRRYVAAFAAHCGLPLADHGAVRTLLAEGWYDDGIVPWDAESTAAVEGYPGAAVGAEAAARASDGSAAAWSAYWKRQSRHRELLREAIPARVMELKQLPCVGDGLIAAVRHDRARRILSLTLRCGALNNANATPAGYYDLVLTYVGAEISPEDEELLVRLARSTISCTQYKSDLRGFELDATEDGRIIHRLEFNKWDGPNPGIEIRCGSLRWKTVSRPDRELPWLSDRVRVTGGEDAS